MKQYFLVMFSAIVLAGGIFSAAKLMTANEDTFLSINVEALSNDERGVEDNPSNSGSGGGNMIRNHYKRKTFEIRVSKTLHYGVNVYGLIYWDYEYKTISCCVSAISAKTCDFSVDDLDCKKYVDSSVIGGRLY